MADRRDEAARRASHDVAMAADDLIARFGDEAQSEALRLSYEVRRTGGIAKAEHWLTVSRVIASHRANDRKASL